MPLQFVHRLRDIRIKQLEAMNKQQQQQQVNQVNNNGNIFPNNVSLPYIDSGVNTGTQFDDIIDELT